MNVTWRQAPTGGWVIEGPAADLEAACHTGVPVTVTRRDGTSSDVVIERTTTPWYSGVHGEYRCYGHPVGYNADSGRVVRVATVEPPPRVGQRRPRRYGSSIPTRMVRRHRR